MLRTGTPRAAAEMNRCRRPTAARYEYGRRDGAGREESSEQFLCYLMVDTLAFRYQHFAAVMNCALHLRRRGGTPKNKQGVMITHDALFDTAFVVGRAGLEPATNGLKVRCSTN